MSSRRQPPRAPGEPQKSQRRRELAEARVAAARRSQTRRRSIAGAVVALAVAAVFGVFLALSRGGADGATATGGSATTSTDPTSFQLPRLNGTGDLTLASFRGKPTVVNFFASWCTACRGELPGFARVSRSLEGRVNFVGVNSLETGDGLAMAKEFGIDWWPIGKDVDGQKASGLHDALGGQGMPITAFYDAAGKLVYVSPGGLPESGLRAALLQYLGVS